MNSLNLTPRLKKIFELVPENNCTADIGTDHAYIPIALVEEQVVNHSIASDINRGPIERANQNISKHNLSEKIETRLGPGLTTLSKGEAQVIIIAGMGGLLIADILETSRDVVNSAELLILQPMTAVTELRSHLSKNGYEVVSEHLVAEEDKLYNIITVKPSGENPYTKQELYLGKNLSTTSPQLFERYRQAVITKLTRRAEGLKKSQTPENKQALREIEGILDILK